MDHRQKIAIGSAGIEPGESDERRSEITGNCGVRRPAIEHPGATLEVGSAVVCLAPVATGVLYRRSWRGFIFKSGENYTESNGCTSKFLESEGITVVTTGANAGAGLLLPGLEGMGLIGKGTIGLSPAGRTALNSPPSILGGALSGVTAKHGSATSSC